MKQTLLKGGTVLSQDKQVGNFTVADVLIEGEKIKQVAPSIDAPDAEVVDASDMIVMPGFVDSHRHTWESVVRNVGTDWSLQKYLGSIYFGNIGSKRTPEDDYIGNLLGALEALDAGVTTILDWTMIMSRDHTEEMIRGLDESGIRAVFAHGSPGEEEYWNRESMLTTIEEAKHIKKTHFNSNDARLTMGLAIRGPEFSSFETAAEEIRFGREIGGVTSMHLGFGTWGAVDRSIEKLHAANLLGPDLNFVHANAISPEEMRLLRDHGGSISATPEVEMMMGHGYPAIGLSLENGVKPSLGVDVVTSTGGDMFAQMKFALQAERARVNDHQLNDQVMPGPELHIKAQEVLDMATIEGAKALLLENKIGSLTPGKQADVIMIRKTDTNMFPLNDPIGTVVQCAHTGNVDSVFVAGKAVKRDGRLINVDMKRIQKLANEARDRVFANYGNPDNAWLV
ncbi:amidohydrolase family protein [Paenalkalicoccus suaedae]|uniref:Amidohydrolase family protein n=1 Tax=Paenalkalicoccus suaedae TaxID=2592382 RepID=A0A859FG85_9BACI|nr:amidohydrolase family protein [Paenalkalicoccus suaedae]QKS72149.1 amidohydrolase family protein [Paenalkalicoccus suaedae]